MADQYNSDNTLNSTRANAVDDSVDYDPSSDAVVTGDNRAYPNHGIDGRSGDDAAKGGVLGAIGGAVVGTLAGGPVGGVIGAIVGGVASDAGVAAVDRVDNDNSPGEKNSYHEANNYAGNRNVDAVVDVNRDYADGIDNTSSVADRTGYDTVGNAGLNSAEYDANGNRVR